MNAPEVQIYLGGRELFRLIQLLSLRGLVLYRLGIWNPCLVDYEFDFGNAGTAHVQVFMGLVKEGSFEQWSI